MRRRAATAFAFVSVGACDPTHATAMRYDRHGSSDIEKAVAAFTRHLLPELSADRRCNRRAEVDSEPAIREWTHLRRRHVRWRDAIGARCEVSETLPKSGNASRVNCARRGAGAPVPLRRG